MPRFSLKTLFLSTTLIAVGIWLALASIDLLADYQRRGNVQGMLCLILACALLGAGCFALYNRAIRGAILGAIPLTTFLILDPLIAKILLYLRQ